MRLEERLRLLDALIGSPEREKAAGGASFSAALGAPFALLGAAIWAFQGDVHPMDTQFFVGLACFALAVVVAWTWQRIFRVARFFTRRSLAKLG